MRHAACLFTALLLAATSAAAYSDGTAAESPTKLPDGVYAVLRDAAKEKDVRPLKDGEMLINYRPRFLKKDDPTPPRFLVVRNHAAVTLDLAGEPTAVKEGDEVVRILLKLRPKAAAALERLTNDQRGRQIAIVLGGEVVTTHKVREVIKGGEVQMTSCAPGGATYLLEQLRRHRPDK
jgi:preprotein translocase subunit SecD